MACFLGLLRMLPMVFLLRDPRLSGSVPQRANITSLGYSPQLWMKCAPPVSTIEIMD